MLNKPVPLRLRLGLFTKSGVIHNAVAGLHRTVDSKAFGVGIKSLLRAAQGTESE